MKAFLPKKIIFWLGLLCIFILLLIAYAVFTHKVSQQVLQPVKLPEVFQEEPTAGIINQEFIEKFTQTAAEAATKFGSQVAAFEIWNEQDLHSPTSIYLEPADYSQLLQAAYTAVKANSSAQVIVGGLASGNVNYLTQMGTISADGIGIHPYLLDLAVLDGKIAEYKLASGGKPLWVTEFGWETPNQTDQANFLVNAYNVFQKHSLPVSVWYCWSDSMNPGFGLITKSGSHKQAFDVFPHGAGVNIDPQHADYPSASQLKSLGAAWVRLVYKEAHLNDTLISQKFDSLIQEYSQAGIKIILILNQETVWPGITTIGEKTEPINLNNPTSARSVWRVESENEESSSSGSVSNRISENPEDGTTFINSTVTGTKQKFPDFASMLANFRNAFWALLPDKIAQKASLPSNQVKMKSVTFAFPLEYDDDGENPQPNNQAEITCFDGPPQPGDDVAKETLALTQWAPLVGALTGVAGITRPESIISSLALYQDFRYFLSEEDWRCSHPSFGPGPVLSTSDFKEAEDNKETFHVKNLLTFIKEFFNAIRSLFVKKEKKGVEMRLHTKLPGGNTAITKSQQISLSKTSEKRGQEFQLEGEVKQISGKLTAVTGLSPGQDTTQPFIFAGQADTWWATCSSLCSSHSEERTGDNSLAWVGGGNFCPSCDPEDYKTYELLPVGKPPSVPPYCHWNEAYGCDYWTCQYDRADPSKKNVETGGICGGCGEGEVAFCEDTSSEYVKCGHPQMLNIAKDVRQPQGPCNSGTPGYDKVCTDYGQCVGLNFTSSVDYYQSHSDLAEQRGLTAYIEAIAGTHGSGPPYGPCFYANPDVCVKEGSWDNWDNCAVTCASLCCSGNTRNYN